MCQYLFMVFKVFCSSSCQSSFPRTLKRKIKLQKFVKKKMYPEAKIKFKFIDPNTKKSVDIDVKFHNRNVVLLLTRGPWTRTCPGKGNFSLLNNLRAVEDKSTDSPSKRKACKA